MKKISYICIIYAFSLTAGQQSPFYQDIYHYKLYAPKADLNATIDYLGYYTSWYQATTPAPRGLWESLSPAAKRLIEKIRNYAERFKNPSPETMPGASKLSSEGKAYYNSVIQDLQPVIVP